VGHPAGRSAIAEVYPALWSRSFAARIETAISHDAYCIAACFARDHDGSLTAFLNPTFRRRSARWRRWRLDIGVPD